MSGTESPTWTWAGFAHAVRKATLAPLPRHFRLLVALRNATSGLGYAAASMLAAEGCRQVIVTGRSLARVQETAAQLAAETKIQTQDFTPLELNLDAPTSVQSALTELVKRGRPVDFLLLNAGMVGGKRASSLRRVSRRIRPRSLAIIN